MSHIPYFPGGSKIWLIFTGNHLGYGRTESVNNLYRAHWLQTSMSVVADQTDVTHAQILMDRTAVNVKMDTITLQQQILALVSEQ